MSASHNFYEPIRAAWFLDISLPQLWELTQKGTIRLHKFNGREYYLGGELDCVKSSLIKPVALLPKPNEETKYV